MKKLRNLEWEDYRHPEFLQSLIVSVNELKFIRLFLKRGSVAMVNEMLRERKSKQNPSHKEDFSNRIHQLKKIKA
ncbi:unnamed protein product [marine sediment metagenome]|uniref:Uncharacterized protein n=1 Tax=marine sediment metagenome TaxID=412755 RepID=X1E3X0_9ZZZZ